MLPRAPLEVPLALHNGAESPRAGSPEAEPLPLPLQPALRSRQGPETCAALGLLEQQTAGSLQSRQKLGCGALGTPRPRNVAYIKEPSEAGLRFLPGVRLPGWRAGKGGAGAGLAATRDSAPGSPAWVPAPRPPASRTCVRFTGPRGPAARGGPLAELGSWCVLLPCPSRLRGRLEPGGRPAGFEDGGTSLNFPAPGEAVHLE